VLNIGTGAGAATVARNESVYFINQHPVLAPVLACAAGVLVATLARLANGAYAAGGAHLTLGDRF
jgi:hypothetical protein